MKKKKILILNAHPRQDSLCNALACEYRRGAEEAGHEVHFVTLRNLKFDPILRQKHGEEMQGMEESLQTQQKLIKWCEHLVIVTPLWFMGMPALLKGYFDRILTPKFAFDYRDNAHIPVPLRLLKHRSARVIYTQGAPRYITALLAFDAFWKALKYGVLMFCGFGPIRRTIFAGVANIKRRPVFEAWLKKVYQLGKAGK